MNQEHTPHSREEHTSLRPADERPLFIPKSRHEAKQIERLRTERGPAFDTYLEHIWNGNEAVSDMEADFENLYWASYDNIHHFADDFIESLGWNEARKQLLRDWIIPTDVLVWDKEAFLRSVSRDFEFIERDGITHVFIA